MSKKKNKRIYGYLRCPFKNLDFLFVGLEEESVAGRFPVLTFCVDIVKMNLWLIQNRVDDH